MRHPLVTMASTGSLEKIIFDYLCCFENHPEIERENCATMFSIQQPLLVFRDLDGTLLDSHSYDWQPAAPGSAVYAKRNITVILCRGKN